MAFGALIVATFSVLLHYHFLFLHYLLFAISLISLLISYRKYATFNNRSLTILFGTKTPGITIAYDNIESVKSETKKIDGIIRLGEFNGPCIKEIKYVLINLKAPLEKRCLPNKNEKPDYQIEDKKIQIAENGLSIILYQPPKGGFRPLLDKMSKSMRIFNAEMFEYEEALSDENIVAYIIGSA